MREKSLKTLLLCTAVFLFPVFLTAANRPSPIQPNSANYFETKVKPILETHCFSCHNGEFQQSGLVLETAGSILKGGALSGPAIIPGKGELSPLIQYLRGEKQPRMPLSGTPLSEREVETVLKWINQMEVATSNTLEEPVLRWPWTKIQKPAVPKVKNESWVKNPIDAFILTKLENKGMVPAPNASSRALLRRIYFSLVGMPPTPSEARHFLSNPSPQVYTKKIEELLLRPDYGVRWARHWLDVVRYADTGGESTDDARSHLWRYRDYVVRAFNQDRPYNRFIKEQIAGDAYQNYGNEAKIGTGFLYQWIPVQRDRSPERRRDVLNDVVGTTGSAFLGLSLACARCHDHKYDPIPTLDYYRIEAFFAPMLLNTTPVPFTPFELAHQKPKLWKAKAKTWENLLSTRKIWGDQKKKEFKQRMKAARLSLGQHDLKDWALPISDADLSTAMKEGILFTQEEQEMHGLMRKHGGRFANPNNPGYFKPMAFTASESPIKYSVNTHVLKGGNYLLKGEEVNPGFLSAITGHSDSVSLEGLSNRRKVLAEWIASRDNPLTARVMVNRIWQYHFGKGLVVAPSDFGKNGGGTRHPELIDWLAWQFLESGWSIKAIHRLILQSNVYQQSMRNPKNDVYEKMDSNNLYFWRRSPIRLEGEAIRDSILAVSGQLNTLKGGPPFFPKIDPVVLDRARTWWEPSSNEERNRRTLYMLQCRSIQFPLINVFDGPNIQESCPVRGMTTVTPQVFSLLNSDFAHEQSLAMSKRIIHEVGSDQKKQIDRAFWLSFQRFPSQLERKQCLSFLKRLNGMPKIRENSLGKTVAFSNQKEEVKLEERKEERGSLSNLCLVLLNMNEFIFLE